MHEMEICSAILFFLPLSLSLLLSCLLNVKHFRCCYCCFSASLHRDVFKNNQQQKAKRVGLKFLVTRYFGRCHITRLCRCCCYFSQLATTQHFLHSRAFRHWRRSICLGQQLCALRWYCYSTFIILLLLSILSLIIHSDSDYYHDSTIFQKMRWYTWRFRKGVLDCSCAHNDVRSWASRLACHKGLQSYLVYHSQLWWARNCIDSTFSHSTTTFPSLIFYSMDMIAYPSNSPVIQHYYTTTPYRSKNACFSYVLCSAAQRFSTQCSLAVMKRGEKHSKLF